MGKHQFVSICGEKFKKKITHFSFQNLYKEIDDMEELRKLQEFPQLDSVSLNGTNVDDRGLYYLGQCSTVTNINLTFTTITDKGIEYLIPLKNLQHLRLKDTDIGAMSIPYFNQMTNLISLQVHETEISGKDMDKLSLPNLKELLVDCDDDEDHATLLALSERLPDCEILVKGRGTYYQGVLRS